MKKLWMGWAVLIAALLAGCQHRPHEHGGGPGGMGGGGMGLINTLSNVEGRALVALTELPDGTLIPRVVPEPQVFVRKNPNSGARPELVWALAPGKPGDELRITIKTYTEAGDKTTLPALLELAKNPRRAQQTCTSSKDRVTCTFPDKAAIFTYDICVKRDNKEHCLDPTGMIF